MKSFLRASLLMVLAMSLGACSQGRRSMLAGNEDELWGAQDLCQNANGAELLGCFQLQLDITGNFAYLDVLELGFDPGQIPYRVLARRSGDSVFHVLGDNITTAAGGTVQLPAINGHYIEEYEEWRVELSTNFDNSGFQTSAAAGTGIPVAQVIVLWPELNDPQY
jgi:hypothetical protein